MADVREWNPLSKNEPPEDTPLLVLFYIGSSRYMALAEYSGKDADGDPSFVNIGSYSCGCCDRFNSGATVFAWTPAPDLPVEG